MANTDLGCLVKAVVEKRVQREVNKALHAAAECGGVETLERLLAKVDMDCIRKAMFDKCVQKECDAEVGVLMSTPGPEQQCYSRLAKLPLSMFGRGLSSSAYGISKLLYQAEFEGIPLDVVEQLSCLTTKLVDRGLAPESTALKLPGVPSALLPGSRPKLGGFGWTKPAFKPQPVAKASPMVLSAAWRLE
eukprot:gene667-biopygen407